MEVELKLEPGRREPKVVVLAGRETPQVRELLERLSALALGPIPAWRGDRAVLLEPEDILRFFADGRGVSVQTAEGTFGVRERLYELEERLDRRTFARISHSEIVNLRKVTAVDLSLTGTIRMTLAGGTVCYVSRRCVKKLRQALGV